MSRLFNGSGNTQVNESNGETTPPSEYQAHKQYGTAPRTRLYYDSFTQDQRVHGIQNEAKKRIDAALGLLKLKKFQSYQ